MSLEKSFTAEKQPCHLRSISRRRLAGLARRSGSGGAGWGYLFARRVSRAASPPGVQQTSRPPQRGSVRGGAAGQSCLRSAALQFPNLPGEGSGEQGRAAGCARRRFPKASPRPEPPRWEGRSQPRRQTRREEQAQVHGSVPPSPSCLPGQGVPLQTAPLLISGTWGLYLYMYILLFGGLCCCCFFF